MNNAGVLFIGNGSGIVFAIRIATGHLLWKTDTDAVTMGRLFSLGIIGSPAVIGGDVLLGTNHFNGRIALRQSTGQTIWTVRTFGTGRSALSQYAGVITAPAAGPLAYFGCTDNKLYAVNLLTGSKKWEADDGVFSESSPAVSRSNQLFIGCGDGAVRAYDALTGALEWRVRIGGRVISSPAVAPDGCVYVGSTDGYLYAIR